MPRNPNKHWYNPNCYNFRKARQNSAVSPFTDEGSNPSGDAKIDSVLIVEIDSCVKLG